MKVVKELPESSPTVLVLHVLADRSESRKAILRPVGEAMDPSTTARKIDPKILEAVRVKRSKGISYRKAAIAVFGDSSRHDQVRYWDIKTTGGIR